jgi:hypothetical protein
MDISIKLKDELSIIFFWIGISGMTDYLISHPSIVKSKVYLYVLLILVALYFKIN